MAAPTASPYPYDTLFVESEPTLPAGGSQGARDRSLKGVHLNPPPAGPLNKTESVYVGVGVEARAVL